MSSLLYGWPYAGLVLAALLVGALFAERRAKGAPPRWEDPAFVLPLLWPMYLVHQFEEHGIDVLGRHFAFLGDICATLGHARLDDCPGDAQFIFVVNVVACPMAFAMPLVWRRTRPLLAAFGWSVPLVNGVAHVAGAIAHRAYNPGLVTSVLLFFPLGAWMLRTMLRAGAMQRAHVPVLFGAGVLLHAVLVGSLVAREHGVLGHAGLLAVNAVNGLLPIGFGLLVSRGVRAALPQRAG
jgi:hypothetical protein